MPHTVLLIVALAVLAQQPVPPSPEASPCSAATAPADVALTQLCAAEQSLRAGAAQPKESPQRSRAWEAAADGFRRASSSSNRTEIAARALSELATVYDAEHLNVPAEEERALRALMAVTPNDLRPMFRLAKLLEDRQLIEASEATLLDARHQQPDDEEANRRLAQFYARRVTALHARSVQTSPEHASNPGEPDANGVYRIGNGLTPPGRSDVPQYPPDAKAAGIAGSVLTEIVIDPSGNVADARVVRSIPLLDEAALTAVRNWHFTPTVVNGQAVPVRMTVTVNFTPR
ncbi:MAG: energy transducer TonB [Vicinamibacterales bacterium]